MPDKNTLKSPVVRPLESEVAHLFSFALGVVAGFNAAKQDGQHRPPFEDLPQSYSLAGGILDSLAGDSVLRTKRDNWYLIEMKRDFTALRSELGKVRVTSFLKAIYLQVPPEESLSIRIKAEKAHQFLYLGRPADRPHPELATLSYLEWTRDILTDSRGRHAKRFAQPFSCFLAEISINPSGFTLPELAQYIQWLNSAVETSGAGSMDIGELIAVATDRTTGTLDLISSATVSDLVHRFLPKPSQTDKQLHTRPTFSP